MTALQKLLAFALRREKFQVKTIAEEFGVHRETISRLFRTTTEVRVPECITPDLLALHLRIIMEKYNGR